MSEAEEDVDVDANGQKFIRFTINQKDDYKVYVGGWYVGTSSELEKLEREGKPIPMPYRTVTQIDPATIPGQTVIVESSPTSKTGGGYALFTDAWHIVADFPEETATLKQVEEYAAQHNLHLAYLQG